MPHSTSSSHQELLGTLLRQIAFTISVSYSHHQQLSSMRGDFIIFPPASACLCFHGSAASKSVEELSKALRASSKLLLAAECFSRAAFRFCTAASPPEGLLLCSTSTWCAVDRISSNAFRPWNTNLSTWFSPLILFANSSPVWPWLLPLCHCMLIGSTGLTRHLK